MKPISHSLVKALRNVPEFAALDDHDLIHIVGISANLHWPSGGVVFEKDAPAEALYIVLSGKVRIFDTSDGREAEVAAIGPGDFFGELALLRDETHSKHAHTVKESELMVIPKERFRKLISADSGLAEHVHQKMEERMRANTEPRDRT